MADGNAHPIVAAEPVNGLALLRQAFPPNQISKLPKPTKKQTEEVKADFRKGIRCTICGTWHHPDVVHLDYVGHAALTHRLLDADPQWSWEPVSFTAEGAPAFDRVGGLWIRLTVCGVTRLGYGHAEGKSGGDAVKEVIGDALRNAAMRFGAALDLWHKGDLHADEADAPEAEPAPSPDSAPARRAPLTLRQRADELLAEARACTTLAALNGVANGRTAARLSGELDRADPELLIEVKAEFDQLYAAIRDEDATPFDREAE